MKGTSAKVRMEVKPWQATAQPQPAKLQSIVESEWRDKSKQEDLQVTDEALEAEPKANDEASEARSMATDEVSEVGPKVTDEGRGAMVRQSGTSSGTGAKGMGTESGELGTGTGTGGARTSGGRAGVTEMGAGVTGTGAGPMGGRASGPGTMGTGACTTGAGKVQADECRVAVGKQWDVRYRYKHHRAQNWEGRHVVGQAVERKMTPKKTSGVSLRLQLFHFFLPPALCGGVRGNSGSSSSRPGGIPLSRATRLIMDIRQCQLCYTEHKELFQGVFGGRCNEPTCQ